MSKIYDKLKELEDVKEEELEHIEIVEEDVTSSLKKKSFLKTLLLLSVLIVSLFLGFTIAKYYITLSKRTDKKVIPLAEKPISEKKTIEVKDTKAVDSPKVTYQKQEPYLYKGRADFVNKLKKKYYDNPNNPVNANNLSVAYSELGRYEEALKYAEKALLMSPNNAYYWNNLGVVLTYLNLFSDAEKCFKKALEISKEEGVFFYNMANLYERLGNTALARENYLSYLAKSDKINPSNLEIVKNKYFKGDK